MNVHNWKLLVWPVALAFLTVAAQGAVHAAKGELLSNAGFERWSDGRPVGWEGTDLRPMHEEEARTGKGALALRTAKHADHYTASVNQKETVALQHDTLYLASVWAKGVGRFRISLVEYGKKGYLGGCSSIHTDLTPEWTQYRFFYGAKGDRVNRVRFDLCLDGKDAFAVFDDASLRRIGPCLPPGPDVVPNGDMEADADADGRPDGWNVSSLGEDIIGGIEQTEVHIARGADGSRALGCSCARPAGRAEPAPDMERWWDWPSQPPPAGQWMSAASSPIFPVEPGRTYQIRYQTRGRRVRSLHVKLRWLNGRRSLRYEVIGARHHGSWDWEEVRLSMTAPSAHVSAARIEFWCQAAGGKLWIDNVSVRPSRCRATGWVVQTHEVEPLQTAVKMPEEPVATFTPRRPGHFSFAPIPKSRVEVSKDGITVFLTSGIRLQFRSAGESLLGVGQVKLGNLPLRNPHAPPIAPLVNTESGGHYVSCRYVGNDAAEDGKVTMHTILRSATGQEDRLDWIYQPVERTIAGRSYVGFAYRYVLRGGTEKITEIADRATWELGGSPIGVTVIGQNAYGVDNVFPITPTETYCGGGGARFAGGDGLDYQAAPEGALTMFYDEPIPCVRTYRRGSQAYIQYRDSVPFAGVGTARTPLKCVLFCRRGDHDEWTRLHDYVYGRHAAFWGIRQQTPMPIMNCWMHWRDLAKEGDQVLYHIADRVAPELEKLGFKVLAVHSVWGRGGCSLDVIEPGEKFGGLEALKYLCRKAAEHGMIVQAWAPTAHMWQHSPLVEQHPDWLIEGPEGRPPTTYCYPEIRGLSFRAGWGDYALGQWRRIREETGLGSLWLDSYSNFTHGITCADRRVCLQQAEGLFRFHARLSQMGYRLYAESSGTLGITACGLPVANPDSANPKGPEAASQYRLSHYVGEGAGTRVLLDGDYYYRLLANKAPCMLYWPEFVKMPQAHAKIARANHDYNEVVDGMQFRHTLSQDRGVEWSNTRDDARILFSYRKASYTRPGLVAAYDVTAGQPVALTGGGFVAEPQHTYRLTVRRVRISEP